jgi:Ferritin-like
MNFQESSYGLLRWVQGKTEAPVNLSEAAAFEALETPVSRTGLEEAIQNYGEPVGQGTAQEQVGQFLQAAAEIEHQLMVEYLYAYFSLTLDAPPAWSDKLRAIFQEEMGHLLIVQNLLLLLGCAPHFARISAKSTANQPFQLRLEPLQTSSIAKYVAAEAPAHKELPPDLQSAAAPAFAEATANGATDQRVGLLYAKIYWLLQSSDTPEGPWTIPPGAFSAGGHVPDSAFHAESIHFQAEPAAWKMNDGPPQGGGRFVMRMADRAAALKAIHAVAEQGEGLVPPDVGEPSHFQQLLEIYIAARAMVDAGQSLPVLPLPTDPTYGPAVLPDAQAEENRIAEASSQLWAELFDAHYTILLGVIHLSLLLPGTAAQFRGELAAHAIDHQMKRALGGLARNLILRRRKDDAAASAKAAAPPFSNPSLPASADHQTLVAFLRAEINHSRVLIGKIAPNPPLLPPLRNIASANTDLEKLLEALPLDTTPPANP